MAVSALLPLVRCPALRTVEGRCTFGGRRFGALTEGTTGLMTLILPENFGTDDRYQVVGNLTRVEAETLVVGYNFDLRTNELSAERVPNPNAGTQHRFVAYRLKDQASKPVSMTGTQVQPDENNLPDDE